MDRLSLLKALADDSRYAIYAELRAPGGARSATELAERLDLHPNTVRLHLERLREVGLVEVSAASHGAVGRPQHQWTLTSTPPSLGLEQSAFRTLAHLLAEAAGSTGAAPEALLAIGRRRGRDRAGERSRSAEAGLPGRAPGPAGGPPRPVSSLDTVLAELADLGFDPVLDPSPPTGTASPTATVGVAFTRCPFREVAAVYPDLVCTLHRGITEGIVEAASALAASSAGGALPASVAAFSTLVDADPCRATLSVGSAQAAR